LVNINNSPKYNESLKFTAFETDIKIENIGVVSLHNFQSEFVDIYVNPNTARLTDDIYTMIYDLEPGDKKVISVPDDLKVKGKTILIRMCYSFNENPLDKIDSIVSPIKLRDDPFYESIRRSQTYREHKCSSVFVKYDNEGLPIIK